MDRSCLRAPSALDRSAVNHPPQGTCVGRWPDAARLCLSSCAIRRSRPDADARWREAHNLQRLEGAGVHQALVVAWAGLGARPDLAASTAWTWITRLDRSTPTRTASPRTTALVICSMGLPLWCAPHFALRN